MTTQLNTELKDLLPTSDRISFENMTQEQFAVKLAAQRLRTTPSSKKRLKEMMVFEQEIVQQMPWSISQRMTSIIEFSSTIS